MTFPEPPLNLKARVGRPTSRYDEIGRACRRDVLALCPPSFGWDGARVLDFGCGAGRTLRHFGAEADRAEQFWGCDIDTESIAWASANLSPPFMVFRNDLLPPLPLEDASLDLVYAFSVFTHLADTWSRWLLEIHRVLRPGGTLIASFLGEGSQDLLGRPWDEDRIGMLVTIPDESFDDSSGPVVFHSEWWIREHWGRCFDVAEVRPWAFSDTGLTLAPMGHGCVAMRKRDVRVTAAELETPSSDLREWTAVGENLAAVHQREAAWRDRARAAEDQIAAIRGSRSWQVARSIASAVNRLRGPAAVRRDPS